VWEEDGMKGRRGWKEKDGKKRTKKISTPSNRQSAYSFRTALTFGRIVEVGLGRTCPLFLPPD
jgi:hypothetical protein